MMLFALNASLGLGSRIAASLGCALAVHEEREFSAGEHKTRPLTDVWGEDVYVVSSLHGDRAASVNDKLCRLAFFVGALRDAGALRVTVIAPYVAYSRKDQKTKPRDPVTTRYVAAMLQSVGVERIVTVDVHNPAAFENAFRCPSLNLKAAGLFAEHFHAAAGGIDTIVSPDLGGIKATQLFVERWRRATGGDVGMAVVEKRRSEGRVSGGALVGDVGERVLIIDDMIGSGTTICRATDACRRAGATSIVASATHGLFQDGAPALFEQPGLDAIVVTDSVDIDRLALDPVARDRVTVLGTAELFAGAIEQMRGGSGAVSPARPPGAEPA
jgi:ribose-phosphate pyrophosphokinase